MDKDIPFSAEYSIGSDAPTIKTEAIITKSAEQGDIAHDIESKYPLAKPRRIIVKARIISE